MKDGDSEKWLDKALGKDLPFIRLNDKRARVYSSDKNFRRCGVGLSAESSVGIYKSTAYIVQMEDGHLICELTTREEQVVERRKYTPHLQDLCKQAIKSGGNIQYQ